MSSLRKARLSPLPKSTIYQKYSKPLVINTKGNIFLV